jgi:hypothetical protein
MKSAITQNTYDEVSRLVECALSADTKKAGGTIYKAAGVFTFLPADMVDT